MLNNFKARNLAPALFYAVASAVEVWFLLVQTARMQQWHGEAVSSLAAFAVFAFTTVVAAVVFNFLDSIECGPWHVVQWFHGNRGGIVAIIAAAGGLYNICISTVIAHYVQMTGAALGLELASAALFGWWWTALIVCWMLGGPVDAEAGKS
jgi:hypothetical protein